MAGCITLKAAAANLAPMIQTFFSSSHVALEIRLSTFRWGWPRMILSLSSWLRLPIFCKNYDYDYNYEIRISLISRRSVCWQCCFLICLHSFWVIQKVSIFNRRCLFYKEISERLSPPSSIFHIARPFLFFWSWSKFSSLRLQFVLKMPWVVISDLPSLPSLHH